LTTFESKDSSSEIQIEFPEIIAGSFKLKDIDLGTSTTKIQDFDLKIFITNPLVYTSYLKLKSFEIIYEDKSTLVKPEITNLKQMLISQN